MARHLLPHDQAFALLKTTSEHANRKMRDVADDILRTGSHTDRQRPPAPSRNPNPEFLRRGRTEGHPDFPPAIRHVTRPG